MTKVYLVTSGEYSDYGVNAVFSNEQLAKAYVDIYSREGIYCEEYQIEEYGLDFMEKQLRKGLGAWEVNIWKDQQPASVSMNDSETIKEHGTEIIEHPTCFSIYCFARDHDHAKKIAQDRFAKFRAEEEGIA